MVAGSCSGEYSAGFFDSAGYNLLAEGRSNQLLKVSINPIVYTYVALNSLMSCTWRKNPQSKAKKVFADLCWAARQVV